MSKKFKLFLPILFAIIFVAGLYVGKLFNSQSSHSEQSIIPLSFKRFNKLSEIMNYIDNDYVDSVSKEKLIDETIQDLLQKLDPHSYYISAAELKRMSEPLEGNFEGIGVQFSIQKDTITVVSPVIGGPSEKVGVAAGDRIVSVDGENVAGIGIKNRDVMDMLRGEGGTKVKIGVIRHRKKDEELTFEITRAKIPLYSLEVNYMETQDLGYIKLSRFAKTTADEFRKASKELLGQGMKKMILDLRGNGGGLLDAAIEISDEFLPEGALIVYTEGRNRPRQEYFSSESGMLQNVDVTVLIDEGSASASEIVSGAIQDNDRGIIIGRRSFGKGLVQEQSTWPDGSATRLTIARYYTPTGRCIQKPYGEGVEAYEEAFQKRAENGEYFYSDSIQFPDSLKFTTAKGKVVYGGGGIMPDIFVPADTTHATWYLTSLYYQGSFYDFAFDYADKNREQLNSYSSAEDYVSNFEVSESILTEFVDFAANTGVAKEPKALQKSKPLIESRLKADIGRNIFGNKAYYPVILIEDKTFIKAKSINQTEGLILSSYTE